MAKSEKIKVVSSYIKLYAWILVVAWSLMIITLLVGDVIRMNEKTVEYAHIDAKTAFDKDIIYRQWSTMHGGVYVPITNVTLPNPYLSNISERDITTPSGRHLTLINPAYMNRQVFELEKEASGAYSHITSLKPIRPENAPDTWEIKALIAFESGEKEVYSIETINGSEYFRLMRPLITTQGCLKCHASQGYKENDIRGGISVSLPMDSIRELSGATLRNDLLIHIILWMAGISVIAFAYYQVSKIESKRNQAEELLKRSKEFAETVINSMSDAIAVIDANNFRIIDVNSAFLDIYGMKKEEVLGKTCYEITHKCDRPCTLPDNYCPLIETSKTGKPSTTEHVHYIKGGEKQYSEISTSPVFDENGKVVNVIHVARDITGRKRGEEELMKREEMFRLIFENAPIGISHFDAKGAITACNEHLAKIMGGPVDKFIGINMLSSFRNMRQKAALEDALKGKVGIFDGEYTSVTGGKTVYIKTIYAPIFAADKSITGGISITEDISERKQAEEALNQGRVLLSLVFNNISDMLALMEVEPDLRMRAVSVNKSYLEKVRLLKDDITEKDILGQERFIFLSKFFGSNFESTAFEEDTKRYNQAIEERKPLKFEQTFEIFSKKIYIEITIAPVFDDAGICRYVLWSGHDITERKIAEENVKKSLNEKEVLLREIHHRVKNNLQIISSLLNLQMGYIKDKNIMDIFSESQNRILSMALVHEKLYQSSDLRNIDFKQYINDLGANLVQSYNLNNIKLNINVEDISLDIDHAIPAGLIINELITNSLKYAFPDGTKGEINISFRSISDDMLELVVSDNGIGLPKELDIRKATTLGLRLVTSLAESQLHGKIDIDRNKGTEFHIKFKGRK